MTENEFFEELGKLLKDVPDEDKQKILSTWKEKWASVKDEKDAESFLSPQEIVDQYTILQSEDTAKPATYEFHPTLHIEKEKKDDNQAEETSLDAVSQEGNAKEEKTENQEETAAIEKKEEEPEKKEKRSKKILLLSAILWIPALTIIFLVYAFFLVGYFAFFLGVIGAILYSLFTFVAAIFQGLNAHIFPALFQGGLAILIALVAILSVKGMNLLIQLLWKGFKKARNFVFYVEVKNNEN